MAEARGRSNEERETAKKECNSRFGRRAGEIDGQRYAGFDEERDVARWQGETMESSSKGQKIGR